MKETFKIITNDAGILGCFNLLGVLAHLGMFDIYNFCN